jgi:hypothetical protein
VGPGAPDEEVLAAARARADALASGDRELLARLLHPDFRWTSHLGEHLDLAAYLAANTGGRLRWSSQRLEQPEVVVDGDTAVLRCTVVDRVEPVEPVEPVDDRDAAPEDFRMPMTQVWVRREGRWQCLAGHAGPRHD